MADNWQMKLNVEKCKVLHYGRSSIEHGYIMHGHPLEQASVEKDLGVVFSKDLKVRQQCEEAYKKASQMLGLMHRTIRFRNPQVLITLYKSLVRPHLEYCSVAWSPYYVKDKALLERVQHRFTRMFSELKELPYMQRLEKLGLWSLEERRNRADLIEIFKMIKGFSAVSWSISFFTRMESSVTRGHNWKLRKLGARCDLRLHCFSHRSINRWNSLTQEEVDAPSVNSFKHHLAKKRLWKMDFFMD